MKTHQSFLRATGVLLLGFICISQLAAGEDPLSDTREEAQTLSPDESCVLAQGKKDRDHGSLKHLEVKVGGQEREALVAYPKSGKKIPAPVIFVFHGHGENMKVAADAFGCHKHWDEAICVYMQGLKTPRPSDPKGLKLGWQPDGERDYLFFDSVLAELKKLRSVDEKRIFATGFSNGAGFTYHLWGKRGSVLRALAPCAGVLKNKTVSPRACLHIAGTRDTVIAFKKQEETIELVRKVNGCVGKGVAWPRNNSPLKGVLYPSSKGAPTAQVIHDGAHEVPAAAGALIVQFFREVAKK